MNGTSPIVSILVPTIGRLQYFDETRRCVTTQTMDAFEVIVLDNASPISAAKAFRGWASEDARVRVLRSDNRLPMFSNFNRGIDAARGEFIAFVHDDDLYPANYLQAAVTTLGQHPSAAFCGSNYDFIDERGKITERRRWIHESDLVSGQDFIARMLLGARSFIATPGLVFRRTMIRKFDDALSPHFGDYVWLMRMAEHHDVCLLTETLVQLRRHSDQASAMEMSRAIPQRTRILIDYCEEYLARHPERAMFVKQARRRIRMVHRLALAWGWAVAPDALEALACLDALGDTRLDRGLRTTLRTVGTPFRETMRRNRKAMRQFSRRIAF